MPKSKKQDIFSYAWKDVISVEEVIELAENGEVAIRLELEDGDLIGLSSEDIHRLCENVNQLASVKALCLINCGMTLEDFQLLFEALENLKHLEYLDISSNPLETDGSKLLAEYIRNSKVKHLNISACNITSTGLSHIIEELDTNSSIRSFILDNNPDLSTNAIVSLYDVAKRRRNIVQFSTLNTYCDVKSMSKIFRILKKHLNILFIGFPTFFKRKKNFVDSLLDSDDSLLEIHKEDLLKFRDVIVQKALFEALKSNFSLVKVFNKHVRQDVRGFLKRNLSLMKNEFNNILLNGLASSNDFNQQTLLVLGRRGSGKSELIQNLFGGTKVKETVDFELSIKKSVVNLQKDENLRVHVSIPRQEECSNFSFNLAAKILARTRGDLKNNEKYLKLSKVVGESSTPHKRNKRRQQLSFYQYPDGQSHPKKKALQRSPSITKPSNGNSLLHSYRNRTKNRGNTKKKGSRSNFQLDQPLKKKRVSFERPEKEDNKKIKMQPNMRKSEIVDSFDPKIIATHGDLKENLIVQLNILEISARVSNSISVQGKRNGSRGTFSSMPSLTGNEEAKKKQSEAEKFGRINNSLIDLVHLCFGLHSESGVLVLTFNIPKLLKYIKVEEERMILDNPITAFLRHNIRIAFSKSKSLALFLVGTNFKEDDVSEKSLAAINLIIQGNVTTKDFKRLIRHRRDKNFLCFHPINNDSRESILSLKNELSKRVYKNAKTKLKQKMYVKYLRAFDILKQEGVPFLSKQDVSELTEEANIRPEDVEHLVLFLKSNNLVTYYQNIDILSDFIIFDRIYLYQLMYQFVNRRYLTKLLNNKRLKEPAREANLGKDLLLFRSKKLLSSDLIEFVWKYNPSFDLALSRGTYLYLIEILKKSLFLTPWQNIRFNTSPFTELAAPITSRNVEEFTTENLFLLTPCIKKSTRGNHTRNTRLRNVRSFAEASSTTSSRKPTENRENRSYSVQTAVDYGTRPTSNSRSRAGGSFEGVILSSRAKPKNRGASTRGRFISKAETPQKTTDLGNGNGSRRIKTNVNFNPVETKTRGRKSKKRIALKKSRSNRRIKINNEEHRTVGTSGKSMNVKPRYLLNKNKPVSILIDFQTSFLPTGLFFRLASALYSEVIKSIKNENRGFKKGIESVELHQNIFKIKFDRVMTNYEDVFSEQSTQGGRSRLGSDEEEMSVSGAKRAGDSMDSRQEEKEYIALYLHETKACIIMIVRDHDMASKYLHLLDAALKLILPQKEDLGEINEFMTMFYNVQLSKRMVKVEVKNNKFITLEVAEKRKFAPWFAKNKRVGSA